MPVSPRMSLLNKPGPGRTLAMALAKSESYKLDKSLNETLALAWHPTSTKCEMHPEVISTNQWHNQNENIDAVWHASRGAWRALCLELRRGSQGKIWRLAMVYDET